MSLPETVTLTELETDALTELVNLGVNRAALSLRELVGEQVHLSVPSVRFVTHQEAIEILSKYGTKSLVVIHEVFEGDFMGRALLIFPEAQSLDLVRAVVGTDMPLEDIIHLETEALAETGNIILSSCLSTIANALEHNLRLSLPEVLRGGIREMLSLEPPPEVNDILLFLYINFTVQKRDLTGYIVLAMDLPSLIVLKEMVGKLIKRTMDGTEPHPNASA